MSKILVPPEVRNPCGTEAAYYRHRYRGEEPCAACKKANSDRVTRWSKGKKRNRNRPDEYQKRTYGISIEEKRALLESQGQRCAVGVACSGNPLPFDAAVTDHHHGIDRRDGMAVRGICCDPCNVLLGLLGDGLDDPELLHDKLAKIERYLTETHPLTQQRLAEIRSRKS